MPHLHGLLLACSFVAVFAGSCTVHGRTIRGSGNVVSRNYPVTGFDRVLVSDALNLEIRQGDAPSLTVTADDNAFDVLRVDTGGGTLRFYTRQGVNLQSTRQTAVLTMPDLHGLQVSGAADVIVQPFRVNHALEIQASGASDVRAQLEATAVSVAVSGASDARLEGAAAKCELQASGASEANLAAFRCSHATAELSGSADGQVMALVELGPVALSGASTLVYSGAATVRDVTTSGAAELVRR
ncbi:MAG: DUF2807 domain-containing protein [Myxococcales bacterium FL481]|nr:MAG: DUF2807 domain-containing protein [Myxococcales bacterium FL481]